MKKIQQNPWITALLLWLVIMLPLGQVAAQSSSAGREIIDRTRDIPEDFRTQGEVIGETLGDRFDQGFEGDPGAIGEDIILNVQEYQPQIIRSSLLEDQTVFVKALLTGQPTNPTITIPQIRDVTIRRQKVTPRPLDAPVSIGRVRHVKPARRDLSYDNMGYLVIPIRQIPQENAVPDEIVVDLDARVFFDVSEGLGFGTMRDILVEQNEAEWRETARDHQFHNGYIRLEKLEDSSAKFVLYDNSFKEIRGSPMTLRVGQTSRSLNPFAGSGPTFGGRLFDQFTIRLESITSLSDKVRLLVNRGGTSSTTILAEGEFLYPGSSWRVEKIVTDVKGENLQVRLRNDYNNEVQELSAQKVKVKGPTSSTASPIPTSAAAIVMGRTEYDAAVTEYNALKAASVGAKKYIDYAPVVTKAIAIFAMAGLDEAVKQDTITLLRAIQAYYNEKLVEHRRDINRDGRSDIDASIIGESARVDTTLQPLLVGRTNLPVSTIGSVADGFAAYRQSREEYQKTINEHTSSATVEVRKDVAEAHWRIANLPAAITGKDSAINHLEILMNNFKESEYSSRGFTKAQVETLLTLLKSLRSDYQSARKELEDPVTGESIAVILAGGAKAPEELTSTATLNLEGVGAGIYREGDQLVFAGSFANPVIWNVLEIRQNSILLVRRDINAIETITINEDLNIKVDGDSVLKRVTVIGTDVEREARITISPNRERAYSEAVFSLHLPIEKRALDLPLFSDTVEEEIAKTEQLLEKLDKIIENVGKITEYWQKFCMITFAALWAKNFFTGVLGGDDAALAREKVSDQFNQKYQEYSKLPESDPRSCKGLTRDECIFKNQAEYDAAISQAENIIDEMQGLGEGYYGRTFGNLTREYNPIKQELYYHEKMGDREKYLELHARLQKAELEKRFADGFFVDSRVKTYEELEAGGAGTVATTLSLPQMTEPLNELNRQLPPAEVSRLTALAPDDRNREIWDKYGDKLMPYFREASIDYELSEYFTGVEGDPANSAVVPYVKSLKTSYGLDDVSIDPLGTTKHNPALSFADGGRGKGNVEFISVDAWHYVQVSYRGSGRVEKYELFRRASPNSPMGHATDVYLGVVDPQMLGQYKKDNPPLADSVDKVRNCISNINKQQSRAKYARGETLQTKAIGCGELGAYVIEQSAAVSGPSCTDFMSPTDCKILFNACDPVVCPPTRCNLGGVWQVDNVVETGIIGSTLLCLPNFIGVKPGGVVMPVCLTGIHAGLQNIRSIIEGYRSCLVTAKVSGRSVGICDRIRSFGICEMLWKEGIAVFNMKEGILKKAAEFFTGADSGGGEYSNFDAALDNSINGLKYFTQSYAKNNFARYSGGSLPEIGTEICKAAIFKKVPGPGDFFDQVTRPESPPQFNAFFDEAPYSDISDPPESQYKVFYHIYAGENEPIRYSVWLQSQDPYTQELIYRPQFVRDDRGVVKNRRLPPGGFASENIDLVLPVGFQEICVEITTDTYGRQVECGFGKVSTAFALNYLTEQFTQGEAAKRVNSAEECVSASSTITPELLSGDLGGAGRGALGTLSSGFVTTGIVRKCSKESPGIGGDEDKWSPVGSCGRDDRDRDMGTCWLYIPAAQNALKQQSSRTAFARTLNETALRVIRDTNTTSIRGLYTADAAEITDRLNKASRLLRDAKTGKLSLFAAARREYEWVLGAFDISEETASKVQLLLAKAYEEEGRFLVKEEKAKVALSKLITSMRGTRTIALPRTLAPVTIPTVVGSIVKFTVKGVTHELKVVGLTATEVSLEIRSRLQKAKMNKGAITGFDLDDPVDGTPDVNIHFKQIINHTLSPTEQILSAEFEIQLLNVTSASASGGASTGTTTTATSVNGTNASAPPIVPVAAKTTHTGGLLLALSEPGKSHEIALVDFVTGKTELIGNRSYYSDIGFAISRGIVYDVQRYNAAGKTTLHKTLEDEHGLNPIVNESFFSRAYYDVIDYKNNIYVIRALETVEKVVGKNTQVIFNLSTVSPKIGKEEENMHDLLTDGRRLYGSTLISVRDPTTLIDNYTSTKIYDVETGSVVFASKKPLYRLMFHDNALYYTASSLTGHEDTIYKLSGFRNEELIAKRVGNMVSYKGELYDLSAGKVYKTLTDKEGKTPLATGIKRLIAGENGLYGITHTGKVMDILTKTEVGQVDPTKQIRSFTYIDKATIDAAKAPPPATPTAASACAVDSYWSDATGARLRDTSLQVSGGDDLFVNIRASDCKNKKLRIKIMEDDFIGDPTKKEWTRTITKDVEELKLSWKAEWVKEGWWLFSSDPEYYIIITEPGTSNEWKNKKDLLRVKKSTTPKAVARLPSPGKTFILSRVGAFDSNDLVKHVVEQLPFEHVSTDKYTTKDRTTYLTTFSTPNKIAFRGKQGNFVEIKKMTGDRVDEAMISWYNPATTVNSNEYSLYQLKLKRLTSGNLYTDLLLFKGRLSPGLPEHQRTPYYIGLIVNKPGSIPNPNVEKHRYELEKSSTFDAATITAVEDFFKRVVTYAKAQVTTPPATVKKPTPSTFSMSTFDPADFLETLLRDPAIGTNHVDTSDYRLGIGRYPTVFDDKEIIYRDTNGHFIKLYPNSLEIAWYNEKTTLATGELKMYNLNLELAGDEYRVIYMGVLFDPKVTIDTKEDRTPGGIYRVLEGEQEDGNNLLFAQKRLAIDTPAKRESLKRAINLFKLRVKAYADTQ